MYLCIKKKKKQFEAGFDSVSNVNENYAPKMDYKPFKKRISDIIYY